MYKLGLCLGWGAVFVYLGEPLPAWTLIAAALIVGGLALNLLWPKVVGVLKTQRL
jgi:O-acetylserine/cysteine efflux transporter